MKKGKGPCEQGIGRFLGGIVRGFLAIALCAVGLSAFAEPQKIGDSDVTWELTENDTVLTIAGTGAMPDLYGDTPWNDASWAITTVKIESGVASVCDCAFSSLGSLRSVSFPSTLTRIGDTAFMSCSDLESITIPESVTDIGIMAFQYCGELRSVSLPSALTKIAGGMFSYCGKLESITIPSGVTQIGSTVFYDCEALARVSIKSKEPPELADPNAFSGTSEELKIGVPFGTADAYKGTANWSDESIKDKIVEAYVVDAQPTEHGTVTVSKDFFFAVDYMAPTEIVTVTAKADEGYVLASLVWNDGTDHDITADKRFTMPLKNVKLTAVFALQPISYLDWDDENKELTNATCTAYEVVTNKMTTFEAGKTYVVTNNVSAAAGITVKGTPSNPSRLILCDGAKLTVKGATEKAGLTVASGSVLVICGQKDGTGTLEATGGELAAGIGGDNGVTGGTVTINGGAVTATGGESAAGIGGGSGRSGGTVTINGGTVTATGGQPAAGIGVGMFGVSGGTVTFGGTGFSVVTGKTATVTAPIAQDDYAADHKAVYVHIGPVPAVVAQFVKGGEVVAEFETSEAAVAALDDAQYADIEEFRIGLAADTVFDFGGRTNRVVIGNVGAGTNTLKNVLLDCDGDYVVTGMVGTVVFGDGVRIEKSALDFKQGWVELIIRGGLYKNDPIGYCEDGYLSARRYDENENLNGLYAVLPAAEIAVEDRKNLASTRYATLQDAFNLIGENKEVTLRLFNNLELGTAVTKLEGNKVIHLLPSEFGANTITRVGAKPVIEIGLGAKLAISNVVFNGANVMSENPKPMIEVAGKTGTKFGWLIAGDGFVVSNAVGGAVHVGNGGRFELDGVAKIIENTTDGKPKNVVIEDKQAIVLKNGGAVTDGNYAQIGVYSDTDKFMIPGGQFGTVDTSYEYATDFADGDISVAKPKVGFINDRDGTLHHAAGAKIAAAPTEPKKTYKRWVGGEYKVTLEEGDYLISRVSSFPSSPTYLPELIWTARQDAPAEKPAPAVLDWTDTTLTLAVSNGCDYAVVTDGSAETNWVSMVGTDNTYAFARPAGSDYLCLKRYSITPSNIVSAATAYSVKVSAGTEGDPWLVGAENSEDVTAWTNGNEFVVSGDGTVSDLSKLASKVTVEKLTIKDATVTVAASDAFQGFGASGSEVSLTLPDGWQGELPDEGGNWYGATVNLMGIPLSVRNVTSLQRYPWNGLVDIGCDLTGAGEVTLSATVLTNGVTFIEAQTFIGETTVDLDAAGGATNGVKFIWNAAADLPAGFRAKDVQLKVTAEQ